MKIRKYIYLLLTMLIIGAASGCVTEKPEKKEVVPAGIETKNPDAKTENIEIDPEKLEECPVEVKGVYTALDHYYDKNNKLIYEEREKELDFTGYASDPEIVSINGSVINVKAVIKDKYYRTQEVQEITYQYQEGESYVYNPDIKSEKIFIEPIKEFDPNIFYSANRVIRYVVEDETSISGFRRVEIPLNKENVKIELLYDTKEGLQSVFHKTGDVIYTNLKDGKKYKSYFYCYFRKKEIEDWDGAPIWTLDTDEDVAITEQEKE